MAAKKKKKTHGSKKRRKSPAKKRKGHIPLSVLKKRAVRLDRIIKARGG